MTDSRPDPAELPELTPRQARDSRATARCKYDPPRNIRLAPSTLLGGGHPLRDLRPAVHGRRELTMARYGYARNRENIQTVAGCAEIFNDNVSGGGPIDGRPNLTRCRARLMLGAELVVPSPELLARSAADLTALVNDLDARGVWLVVLDAA